MKKIFETILKFQYQNSRLFTLGFNKKRYKFTVTKDKLFAVNSSKNTFITLLFTLFFCSFLFIAPILIQENKNDITADLIVVSIIQFIIGLAALRQFLWLINGRQELTIENGNLTLVKKGTFLTKPRTYSLNMVTNIRQGVNENNLSLFDKTLWNISLSRKLIFRQTMGQILFGYNGKTIRVFNDLNNNETKELITEIIKRK